MAHFYKVTDWWKGVREAHGFKSRKVSTLNEKFPSLREGDVSLRRGVRRFKRKGVWIRVDGVEGVWSTWRREGPRLQPKEFSNCKRVT
jgi:hypothetical protein